jgi:signal transduction histidine kinase
MAFEIENNIIELKQKTLSKQRFIDNFTHEIKTPLTSIIGYADILRKNKYDKEIFDKGLYHIYDEGLRLEHLSKQLNEMILLRNKVLDITTVNINSLIKDVIEVNEMRLYGKTISLNIDCESFEVDVDKYLLKTVLINLIDNSIKASDNNQTITIGAVKEETTVTIFVKDHGRGISKADLDLITEPFYMVDNSRSKKEESFGLGLSICSDLVNMMGASFKIESELGKGTKVEITIEFTTS